MKKLFQKPFVKNILLPIVRGASKSIPGIGTGIEIATNVAHEFSEKKEVRPHNYWSIAMQALCIAGIVYAFYTKAITIDDLLRLLGQFSGE